MSELIERSVKIAVILAVITAAILTIFQQWRFALGLLAGAAWSVISLLLLVKILDIAVLHKSKQKLFIFLLIKFPILYLIGFLMLVSGFFPVSGILIGLGFVLLTAGVVGVCPRLQ